MGSALAALLPRKKDIHVLMMGLASAGKTSLLYHVKNGEPPRYLKISVSAHTTEQIDIKPFTFWIWDLAGRVRVPPV